MPRALIVEDDLSCSEAMTTLVESRGFEADTVTSLKEAKRFIRSNKPELVLVDLGLPDGNGMDLLENGGENSGEDTTRFVVITGQAGLNSALHAMREGAMDYLTKPIEVNRLKEILTRFSEHNPRDRKMNGSGQLPGKSRTTSATQRGELAFAAFSPVTEKLMGEVDRLARTSATALLIGESGTGKELVARRIHDSSPRARHPFIPVNSGAVSPNLIESQLFGHERGSFTGANSRHHGFFKQADQGTLFLDEITEMSPELQIKLLRVLETGQVMRVGGSELIGVDVRVIAATNRDPREAVKEGKLREDLYFRLNVFPIVIPPLRERLDEIPALAELFLKEFNEREGTAKTLDADADRILRQHRWPGNVRELRNVIERACILVDDHIPADLLDQLLGEVHRQPTRNDLAMFVGSSVKDIERSLILATLDAHGGDKRRSAEVLGFSLKTLYNRLHEIEETAGDD